MDVVEEAAPRELHLAQAEVDGDRLRDVEEPAVGGEGDGEPVQALEDVGALVLLEHVHGETVRVVEGVVDPPQGRPW